MYLFIYLERRQ